MEMLENGERIGFLWLCVALCVVDALKWRQSDPLPSDPEISMTTTEIIAHRGFQFEVHHVTSEDGYILELHRIPRGSAETPDPTLKKRPVLIHHGLLGSSADWVINPTNSSLPFILADQGYDVWLGNARGNTYSRQHLSLDPSQEAFWNFSWDQMGKYDIPAVMTYILKETGRDKLIYVGHSMGTAIFWVAMITRPEFNDKVESMFALAPVSSLAHMTCPIKYLAPFQSQIQLAFRAIGGRAFLDLDEIFSKLQRQFCDLNAHHASVCRNIRLIIGGADTYDFNLSVLPVIYGHAPAGTSIRTVAQFAQNYNAGETFIPYDFGPWGNLFRYGSIKPPPYDLSKVTAPVYLFWGQNDHLASPQDTEWLAVRLANLKGNIRVSYPLFNHFDFLFAIHVRQLLYDPMIVLMPPAHL